MTCSDIAMQQQSVHGGRGRVFGIYMHNWDVNEERASRCMRHLRC